MNRIGKLSTGALLLAVLAFCGGCVSLEHVFDSEQRLEMYGGTKRSWAYISDETSSFFGSVVRLVDLPLTAVMDTLLLPVSAPVQISRSEDE